MSDMRTQGRRAGQACLNIIIVLIVGVSLAGITVVHLSGYGENNLLMAFPQGLQGGNYTFGTISSIQNNEAGDPFWIVSGHWKSNLLNVANQSQAATSQGNVSQQQMAAPVFNTSVRMITVNGTGEHTHTITNFALGNVSKLNNMTTVFEGTSTASLRDGPVTDIPTTITIINGKVISIWLDPAKINNHYGDTPVYGTVTNEIDFRNQQSPPGYLEATNNTQPQQLMMTNSSTN
jgi:hypothetical protein